MRQSNTLSLLAVAVVHRHISFGQQAVAAARVDYLLGRKASHLERIIR
jgi:hypothetical protein